MAKKDEVILIIAKAFGKQRFTEKDTQISKQLSVSTLVSEYQLTVDQAEEVIKWCAISCASLPYDKEVLEENFFKRLFSKKNKKKDYTNLVRRQINGSRILNDTKLGEFLSKASKFQKYLETFSMERYIDNPSRISTDYDSLIDKALSPDDFAYHKRISKDFLKNLNVLLEKLEDISKAIDTVPIIRSAKNEARKRNDAQNKFLKNLLDSPRYAEIKKENIIRLTHEFVDFLCKSLEINKNDKAVFTQVVIGFKKYVENLRKDYEKIIDAETKSNTYYTSGRN